MCGLAPRERQANIVSVNNDQLHGHKRPPSVHYDIYDYVYVISLC